MKKFVRGYDKKLAIFCPKSLKNEEFLEQVRQLLPDFIVVASFGKILPKELLEIAPCINVHTSLLPKYRGASPIQAAILADDELSGVSIMKMEESLDSGDVFLASTLNIKDKRADILAKELSSLGAKLLKEVLSNYAFIKPVKQDESKASFCKPIKKEDGLIRLDEAALVYKKYLAFYPWPGVFLENGLKLIELKLLENESKNQAGKILKIQKDSIILACERGSLEIASLQASGKKILNAKSYCNGKRLKEGGNIF